MTATTDNKYKKMLEQLDKALYNNYKMDDMACISERDYINNTLLTFLWGLELVVENSIWDTNSHKDRILGYVDLVLDSGVKFIPEELHDEWLSGNKMEVVPLTDLSPHQRKSYANKLMYNEPFEELGIKERRSVIVTLSMIYLLRDSFRKIIRECQDE